MDYDWKKIGERIKEERKELGLTQIQLIERIGLSAQSRQLIGRWEKGESYPEMEDMTALCKVFNCEIGYLLCEPEYSSKTRKETDIKDATGLSEKVIKKLLFLRTYVKGDNCPLNAILAHDDLIELLTVIQNHVWSYNRGYYKIENEKPEVIEALVNTFNCEPSDLKKYIEVSSQSLIESTLMKIVNDIE